MSAQFAKDEMSFVMPTAVSRAATTGMAPTRHGLAARLAGAVQWLADLPRRQAVINELNALSDHELEDIGLTRGDVGRVFDRGFAAERTLPRGAGL